MCVYIYMAIYIWLYNDVYIYIDIHIVMYNIYIYIVHIVLHHFP